MKHLNPIKSFDIHLYEKGIFKRFEQLSVEKYISLEECIKSVRKRLKKAKSEGLTPIVYYTRQSGSKELITNLKY